MLIYKQRSKSIELQMLEALDLRLTFTNLEKLQLSNGQSGHTGEEQFDEQLAQTGFDGIVLNDLSFQENGAFQLDSLLLAGDRMILYDMKNYAGDYFYRMESSIPVWTMKSTTLWCSGKGTIPCYANWLLNWGIASPWNHMWYSLTPVSFYTMHRVISQSFISHSCHSIWQVCAHEGAESLPRISASFKNFCQGMILASFHQECVSTPTPR